MNTESTGYPPARVAWWTVFVLFVAYTFSYIDRSILSLLVQPIKHDLQLNDTQIGLLQGVAFALLFAVAALPLGWLSDRKSRRMMVGCGMAFWSFMTVCCGLASNFWQMFFARTGVGVGEAVLSPASISVIGDIFPKEKRGFALAFYAAAAHVGAGLAYIVGGTIIQFADQLSSVRDTLGGIASWQLVFIMVGAPGIVVALLSRTMHEPRHGKPPAVHASPQELFAFMRQNAKTFAFLFTGFPISGIIAFNVTSWGPTQLIRNFHLSPHEVGWLLGIPHIVFCATGGLFAGWMISRWTKKGLSDAPFRSGATGMCIVTPLGVAAPLMPNVELTVLFYALFLSVSGVGWTSSAVAIQAMTPPNLRAQVSAIYFFVVTIVTIMLGPLMIGVFNDYVFQSAAAVNKSMALLGAIAGFGSAALIALGMKSFRGSVENLQSMGQRS